MLVTIDDLNALMEIMRRTATDPDSLQVQFSGGYFTDAADLKELSDDEIRSLRVQSDTSEVNLAPDSASAIGASEIINEFYSRWARTRQTNLERPQNYMTRPGPLAVVLFLVALLAAITPIVGFKDYQWIGPATLAAFTCVMWTVAYQLNNRSMVNAGAIIKPMTMHEWRQLQLSNQNPRRANLIATVSVVVALLALAAAFITPLIFGK